ncbi:UNVERIFIED_CONTAM: hypothetical protein PYX00_000383 [Menopon gallinae]|uniref:Uncharacterized protein n=1 Tax=Menopon gallinae TaxID=328185 RepID=A0AAW2I9J3_9NEOP
MAVVEQYHVGGKWRHFHGRHLRRIHHHRDRSHNWTGQRGAPAPQEDGTDLRNPLIHNRFRAAIYDGCDRAWFRNDISKSRENLSHYLYNPVRLRYCPHSLTGRIAAGSAY